MKALLFFLLVAISLLPSCEKSEELRGSGVSAFYEGTYVSSSLDTSYVTTLDETYTRIRWCALGNSGKINFDSVHVFPDSTYTINQLINYSGSNRPVIGTGSFGTGTTSFHFVIDGYMHINFFGVKKP